MIISCFSVSPLPSLLLEFLTAEAQKYAENLRLSSISAQKCYQDNAIYGRSFGIDALDLAGRDYIDLKGTSLGQVLEVVQKSKRDATRFSDEFSRITLALIARTKGLGANLISEYNLATKQDSQHPEDVLPMLQRTLLHVLLSAQTGGTTCTCLK